MDHASAPDTSSSQRNQQDLASRINLERFHRRVALLAIHRAIETIVADMLVRESVAEAVEQGGPLREDDRFDDFALNGLETDRAASLCGLGRGVVVRVVVVRGRVDHRERQEISQQMAIHSDNGERQRWLPTRAAKAERSDRPSLGAVFEEPSDRLLAFAFRRLTLIRRLSHDSCVLARVHFDCIDSRLELGLADATLGLLVALDLRPVVTHVLSEATRAEGMLAARDDVGDVLVRRWRGHVSPKDV